MGNKQHNIRVQTSNYNEYYVKSLLVVGWAVVVLHVRNEEINTSIHIVCDGTR